MAYALIAIPLAASFRTSFAQALSVAASPRLSKTIAILTTPRLQERQMKCIEYNDGCN